MGSGYATSVFRMLVALFVLLAAGLLATINPAQAAHPGDNGKVVFTSARDGNDEIYLMDNNGANQTRLTNNSAIDLDPDLSPDGRSIVFTSNRDGDFEVFVMNSGGGDVTQLTDSNGPDNFQPVWSSDGDKIAFVSGRDGGNLEIYVMDADGGNETRLTNHAATDLTPAFSPDGSKIAFSSTRDGGDFDIFTVPVEGGAVTQLTANAASDANPDFSPDGTRIVFDSTRDVGNGEIYTMDSSNGTSVTRLTTDTESDFDPVFSPDGSKVAFSSLRSGDANVHTMNSSNGGSLAQLTNNAAPDLQPDWGPLVTNADLTISKSDSADPIKAGQQLTYSITVENKGPDSAQNVVITDQLPSATTFVSATGGCTNASGTATCSIGTLANGASASRQIVVNTTTAGDITNTASVESDTVDFYLSNNTDREDTEVATNRAPTASDDFFSTNEDTPLNVAVPGVLGDDSDPDGDTLTVGLPRPVTGPTHGALTLNASGSFTYTPNANYNGTDSFTYKANDGTADSNVATVNIRVDPVNDAPTANPDSASVPKNSSSGVDVEVIRNDTDPENDNLTVQIGSVNVLTGGGTATRSSDGKTINYKPATGFTGPATFEYRATDGTNISNLAVVTVTVLNNQSPNATTDSFIMNEGATLSPAAPGVLVNDGDPDGDPITAVLVNGPSKASGANFSLNANGSFTYKTDNANFNGVDSFTYKANDGSLDSNVVTVNIRIDNVNDAPVADNDGDPANVGTPSNADRIQVAKNGTVDVDILDNDSDPDGDTLTPTIITGPNNGTASVIGGNNKKIRYAPNAGFSGNDSLVYQVSDGNGGTDTATVFLRVAANGTPVAVTDSYETDEDTPLAIAAPGVLANDADPDGDALTVNDANTSDADIDPVSPPANGTLVLNADGSFTYTPNLNFSGPDSFTYRATDGTGTSNIATVIISVKAINDAPIANDDSAETEKDTPVTIDVLGNDDDPDNDPLSLELSGGPVTQTGDGEAEVTNDNKIRYTPDPGFVGVDTFDYDVCDDAAPPLCDTATITVTVGDSGLPTVVSVSPRNGDQIVNRNSNISVTFSEAMDPQSIQGNIKLFVEQTKPVAASVSYDVNDNTATLDPASLIPGRTYTVVVKSPNSISQGGVRDLSSNAMASDDITLFGVNSAPIVIHPKPSSALTVNSQRPLLRFFVRDDQTELNKRNVKVFLDQRRVGFHYNPANDRLQVRPGRKLGFGRHAMTVVATDPQGLVTKKHVVFIVAKK